MYTIFVKFALLHGDCLVSGVRIVDRVGVKGFMLDNSGCKSERQWFIRFHST